MILKGFRLHIRVLFLILCSLLFSQVSHAQDGSVSQPILKEKAPPTKDQNFKFKLDQNYFYAPKPVGKDPFDDRNLMKVGLSYKGQNQSQKLFTDAEYFYSESEDKHYLNLKEFYYSVPTDDFGLFIGRKKLRWSAAEQFWNMGQWQPRFMWSRLRPEENGLTGVFVQGQKSSLEWTLFLSPLYIPEMGPQYHFAKNEFNSINPWFKDPAPRATVPGLFENKKVVYNVFPPSVGEVLQQRSLAFQLKWTKGNNYCQSSISYKPMNQILLSVDPVIRIDLPDSPPGVDVYPFVADHRLLSGECGLDAQQGWFGFVSINHEGAIEKSRNENWVTKSFEDTNTAMGLVGFRTLRSQTHISLMNLWGGDTLDRGIKASQANSFFENRYEFYQALQLGHTQKDRWFKKPVSWNVGAIWDIQQKAWLWISEVAVELKSNVTAFLQADGLALAKGTENFNENSFFNVFKMNDQVSAGVQIAF